MSILSEHFALPAKVLFAAPTTAVVALQCNIHCLDVPLLGDGSLCGGASLSLGNAGALGPLSWERL